MTLQPIPLPGLALPEDPPGLVAINEQCSMQAEGNRRLIAVGGVLTANYALGDGQAEAMAMVNLIATRWSKLRECVFPAALPDSNLFGFRIGLT